MVFNPVTPYGGAASPDVVLVPGSFPYDPRSVRTVVHNMVAPGFFHNSMDPRMLAHGIQYEMAAQHKTVSKRMEEFSAPFGFTHPPHPFWSTMTNDHDTGSDTSSDSSSQRSRRSAHRLRKKRSVSGQGATMTFETQGSPNGYTVNIGHVENGTFHGPTFNPVPAPIPHYYSAIATPPVYIVQNSPPPNYVNLGRPDDLKQSDPWSANYKQPVIDVSTLLSARRDITIQTNPAISSSTRPFNLHADLRTSFDRIFTRNKGDGKGFSRWADHEQPATLPKLNCVTLISPLLEGELTISNINGVTCGDILRAVYSYAQGEVNRKTWNSLDDRAKAAIVEFHEYNRPPHVKHSVLAKRTTTNCDVFYDKTCFTGIRRDEEYIIRRVGWNNPACFVMDLDRQWFGWKDVPQ